MFEWIETATIDWQHARAATWVAQRTRQDMQIIIIMIIIIDFFFFKECNTFSYKLIFNKNTYYTVLHCAWRW